MTVSTVKIPPLTTIPVGLGTAIGRRHTPMAAGFKSVSTIGNPDFPALFARPGLVVPDHLYLIGYKTLKTLFVQSQFLESDQTSYAMTRGLACILTFSFSI